MNSPDLSNEPTGWPDDATRDRLIGDWWMYQRRGGHRTSTDDLLAAWFAVVHHGDRGAPAHYVDLGCGIGSVLFQVAWRLRPLRVTGVEAQAQSALMAQRSASELPSPRPEITILHQDLRSPLPEGLPPADVVTGSPPYFPVGTGVLSPDAQRRACRFELRGGVEAYCEAASRLLAPDGVFCLVFTARDAARVHAAGRDAGLALIDEVPVLLREGAEAPLLAVYAFCRPGGRAPRAAHPEPLVVRDRDGALTDGWLAVRRTLGLDAG